MRRLQAAALVLALVLPVSALAQSNVTVNFRGSGGTPTPVSAATPLPVNASVSASVSGFAPSLAYATCTATGSTCASTALPTNTGTVILFNSGTTTVSCTLAAGAATATTNELQIPASSGLPVATVYSATTYDHFACIDQSGSASNVVIASGGTGLGAGWGGGGGSGGGGAVTLASGAVSSGAYSSGSIASGAYASGAFASGAAASGSWADGSIVTLGTKADTACSAAPCSTNGWLAQIHSDVVSPPVLGSSSGGWTPKLLNGLSTTVTSIKSSAAGQLGYLACGNTNAAQGYVQVFDVATAGGVTLGTTVPNLSLPIPASNTTGFTLSLVGMQFANGIQVAATTTATGLTALGTALDCNAGFN